MIQRLLLFIVLLSNHIIVAQSENVLAENYYRNNEFEKAIQLYEKLVEKSPYNTTYLQRLVASYQEINKFEKVDTFLKKEQQQHKNLPFYDVLIGYNYERQHQLPQAQKYYQKALNAIDKKAGYSAIVANFFKKYNKLDLAITAYEKAENKNPKLNYSLSKAQIYGEQGNFDKMFKAYIDLVNKSSDKLKTVQRYTAKFITDNSESETNIAFKKALLRKSASNPKPVWNILLSWLFTQQKDFGKAFVQQKALYTRDTDNLSGIIELGEIAFSNTDYEASKKCFDFILEKTLYPDEKISAHLYLLRIAILENEPEIDQKFNVIFEEFGKNNQTLPIQIAYADYLTFQNNQPLQAKTILEEAQAYARSKFQKARIKLKLGDVLVFTEKYNKALIYFSQVQSQLKNHYLAQLARFKVAQTSYFKGDFEWAKAQLKVLKGSATQLIANDAVKLYVIISDNEPKDSIPSGLKEYAKADLLAYQNKNEEALVVLDEIFENYKGQPVEDEALFKQGKILLKLKRYQEAILTFTKVIAMDKEGILNDDAYYQIAEMYNNQLNNTEKAKEYYQKIIFEHPSSIYLVDARKKFRKLRGDNI